MWPLRNFQKSCPWHYLPKWGSIKHEQMQSNLNMLGYQLYFSAEALCGGLLGEVLARPVSWNDWDSLGPYGAFCFRGVQLATKSCSHKFMCDQIAGHCDGVVICIFIVWLVDFPQHYGNSKSLYSTKLRNFQKLALGETTVIPKVAKQTDNISIETCHQAKQSNHVWPAWQRVWIDNRIRTQVCWTLGPFG